MNGQTALKRLGMVRFCQYANERTEQLSLSQHPAEAQFQRKTKSTVLTIVTNYA
jgi:hypothetical protein